jgi:hypothetical protein
MGGTGFHEPSSRLMIGELMGMEDGPGPKRPPWEKEGAPPARDGRVPM